MSEALSRSRIKREVTQQKTGIDPWDIINAVERGIAEGRRLEREEGLVVEVGLVEMYPDIFLSVVSSITEEGLINVPAGSYRLLQPKEDK